MVLHPHSVAVQLQCNPVPSRCRGAKALAIVILTGAAATPVARYFMVLSIVVFMTWIASNLLRGRIGRSWMMIRDMDIAAELMGVRPLFAKLIGVCGVVVLSAAWQVR
jgi:ABC-type branched-subunit amino acid transport system permease subunit